MTSVKDARVIRSATQLVRAMVPAVADLRDRIEPTIQRKNGLPRPVVARMFGTASHRQFRRELADALAQTTAFSALAAQWADPRGTSSADFLRLIFRANPLLDWLPDQHDLSLETVGATLLKSVVPSETADNQLDDVLGQADLLGVRNDFETRHEGVEPLPGLFELFLSHYDRSRRRRAGVYFTPRSVVQFIIRGVDEFLQDQFGLSDGLADTSTWSQVAARSPWVNIPHDRFQDCPFVQVLDPASGTGAFLVEVIDTIHTRLTTRWRDAGRDEHAIARLWREYVEQHLIRRVCGFELLPGTWALSHVLMAIKLHETGYSPDVPPKWNLLQTNPLEGPHSRQRSDRCGRERGEATMDGTPEMLPTVFIGNPPFSGISENNHAWIDGLLKGRLPNGTRVGSYYEVDGRPLGERKVWLQDDYVKFIRLAEWGILQAGCGILGYVTNHGYLDNPTFRGMRQRLMETFSHIWVVDLHGNRKKDERRPDGHPDQNVFAIEQGVAVGMFGRGPSVDGQASIRYGQLWGDRPSKIRRLKGSTPTRLARQSLRPAAPYYFWFPYQQRRQSEYERGFCLPDILPIHSTAVVTARDRFVIDVDPEPLQQRLEQFRDLSIPDGEIRARFFGNGRSRHYPPGDTRGWKLSDARRRLAELDDWQQYLRSCWYRPFDRRTIFWADWMIDWPRVEVSSHLLTGDNLALIVRRQILRTGPCNFFWISDDITIDGLIRSDNRGSESLFPLYVHSTDGPSGVPHRKCNLTPSFVEAVEKHTGLHWTADGGGDFRGTLGPLDVLHLTYALFHSPTYRKRYADSLRAGFPRIFLTADTKLLESLCRLGQRLVGLHLLRANLSPDTYSGQWQGTGDTVVAPGYPQYVEQRVYVNPKRWLGGVDSPVWQFRVGAHQACRKWLKDRRGRILSEAEMQYYTQIVAAVAETIDLMGQIDQVIDGHGGWPTAFRVH